MRYATIAVICLLSLAAGTASAIASTPPGDGSNGVLAGAGGDETSSAVHALRHEIRATRSLALRTAYVAALRAPRHGHAERRATTVPELVPILLRWQHRLRYYRAALQRRQPALDGLRCIHQYEGAWDAVSDSVPAYYGGLQMDRSFERTYGYDVLAARHGRDANRWPPHDQLMVAMRAYRDTGYGPWPNTSTACGLS